MCAISTFSCEQVKPLNFRPPCCWLGLGTLSMRRSLVAPLSGAAQCDIVIAIYRISLSFAGNELETIQPPENNSDDGDVSIFGPAQNEHPCGPNVHSLASSGVLDPLARAGPPSKKSSRASSQCRGLDQWKDPRQLRAVNRFQTTLVTRDFPKNVALALVMPVHVIGSDWLFL